MLNILGLLTGASILSILQMLMCCCQIFLPQKKCESCRKVQPQPQQATLEKSKADDAVPEIFLPQNKCASCRKVQPQPQQATLEETKADDTLPENIPMEQTAA
jgi:hypothetical protein